MMTFAICPAAHLPSTICGCNVKRARADVTLNVLDYRRCLISLSVSYAPFEGHLNKGRYIYVLFMCNVERMFSMFAA